MKQLLFLFLLMYMTQTWSNEFYFPDDDPQMPVKVVHTYKKDLTKFSYPELKAIFTRRMILWSDGEPIKVFIKPIKSLQHREFLLYWLHMTTYRYVRLLEKQTYSGKTMSVIEVANDDRMIEALKDSPNSIGYLNEGEILYNTPDSDLVIVDYYK